MANTARPDTTGFFTWEAEDSFADSADDTITYRSPVRARIDLSGLARPMVDRGGMFQHAGELDFAIPGAYGEGTFTIELDAAGHGTATDGALTETDLFRLLRHCIGEGDSSQVGGLLTTGTNDVDTLTSTNTTIVTGAVFRVGAQGDGRAEGHATMATDSSSPYTLRFALPGNPTTADDVHAMLNLFQSTDPADSIMTSDGSTNNNTLRCIIGTDNYSFACKGVACNSIALSGLNPGEIPRWTLGFSCAYWKPVATTFPDSVTVDDWYPAPCASGSLFLVQTGTSTRTTVQCLEYGINFGHSVIPVMGPGGENSGQNIVGWRRVTGPAQVTIAVEAEANTATPTYWDDWLVDPNTQTWRSILYTCNRVDGRALAISTRQCRRVGSVPTQVSVGGVNAIRLTYESAAQSAQTIGSIAAAPVVIGMG